LPSAIAPTHAGRSGAHWIQHAARVVVAQAPAAHQAARRSGRTFLGAPMVTEEQGITEPFAERHYTVNELASMWRLSGEFVRQLVQHEQGVTEWVRQQPGRRRYRVLRVPQSVAERVYRRALGKAREQAIKGVGTETARKFRHG
jgi:hypothetical protein